MPHRSRSSESSTGQQQGPAAPKVPLDATDDFARLIDLRACSIRWDRAVENLRDAPAPERLGLRGLPKLAMVMFGACRHYTHTLVKRWNWNDFDHPDRLLELRRPKR